MSHPNSNPSSPLNVSTPWYREPWPWFLMSLPLAAVLAGIVTTVYAVRSNDGVVADDYYKQGLAINQTLARGNMAAQLALVAALDVDGREVQVQLRARTGVQLPERLTIVLSHPTRQGEDQRATLSLVEGVYRGALALQGSGLRTVIIEDEARSWRLSAGLQLPVRGARLQPVTTQP